MKKVLLFLFLINLSLFAQSYIDSLYDAIKENNPKKITDIANNYKVDLNNVFYVPKDVSFDGGGGYGTVANISPLIYAIECKNIEAIDTLLKLGANVWQLTDIYTGYDEEYFIILDDGYTNVSITPLMYAAYSSTEEVISFLIKKGAKVNSKDREGRTALMYSSSDSSSKILINAGANVNAKDRKGKTALMYSQDKALISAGADVNAKDNDGWTALMYACDGIGVESVIKNPDIIKSLIRAGANINEVNNDGDTALMWAIRTYRAAAYDVGGDELEDYTLPTFETIRFLIYNGANVNIKNKKGETPLSLSKELPQLTKLLINNGAY